MLPGSVPRQSLSAIRRSTNGSSTVHMRLTAILMALGLHLAIEALGIKHSGGATVLADLISAAVSDDRFSKVSIFCSPRSSRAFEFPASAKICELDCPIAERNR